MAAGMMSAATTAGSVYQNYERPFAMTAGDPFAESVNPMLRSLNQGNSAVGDAFFSPRNVETIQRLLRQAIRQTTGYLIDRQSSEQLAYLMRSVYGTESNSSPMSLSDEIRRLNLIVVSEATPIIASALAAYLAYIRDASRLKTPLPRGVSTGIKGTRQLSSNSWI